MNLSENFTLEEMCRSETAARYGISNVPPAKAIAALKALCVHVLEPLRANYRRPIIVTSGYRSPDVNMAIGGAATSQHCKGEATDFTVHGVSNWEVCQHMQANMNYDQLIYEFGETGWVHVSWRDDYRNQELTARRQGRRTVYLPGLKK